MTKEELKNRTQKFHVSVLLALSGLPKNNIAFEVGKQLGRCSGSVGANYRAALRAKSRKDFINKIQIIIEEADETLYWLEVCKEAQILATEVCQRLHGEGSEILKIFVATAKTLKGIKS